MSVFERGSVSELRSRLLLATRIMCDLVKEVPPSSNRGPALDVVVRAAGGALGDYWCLWALGYAGKRAARDVWPFPDIGYCPTFAEYARAHGMIRTPAEQIQPGDIILFHHADAKPKPRLAHAAVIVETVRAHGVGGTHIGTALRTHEGNTWDPKARERDPKDPLGRNGVGMFELFSRVVGPNDCVINWTKELEP